MDNGSLDYLIYGNHRGVPSLERVVGRALPPELRGDLIGSVGFGHFLEHG
jgi:hypothetical protein